MPFPTQSSFIKKILTISKVIQTCLKKSTLASELQAPLGLASLTIWELKAWKVLGWEVYLKASGPGGWQPVVDGGSGLLTPSKRMVEGAVEAD